MSLLTFILNIFKPASGAKIPIEFAKKIVAPIDKDRYNDIGIFTYNIYGFEINFKQDGFYTINWRDIERVKVYKVDLHTTDEVCMDLTFDNKSITITEETNGWYQFIEKLKQALPSIKENWQSKVLESPFEYDLMTIYERVDRIMPEKSNFYSFIKEKNKDNIGHAFQKKGWYIRKSSMSNFEISNSWSELESNENDEGVSLNGLIAFHPENTKIIREIYNSLNCPYKFEFYSNDILLESFQKDML